MFPLPFRNPGDDYWLVPAQQKVSSSNLSSWWLCAVRADSFIQWALTNSPIDGWIFFCGMTGKDCCNGLNVLMTYSFKTTKCIVWRSNTQTRPPEWDVRVYLWLSRRANRCCSQRDVWTQVQKSSEIIPMAALDSKQFKILDRMDGPMRMRLFHKALSQCRVLPRLIRTQVQCWVRVRQESAVIWYRCANLWTTMEGMDWASQNCRAISRNGYLACRNRLILKTDIQFVMCCIGNICALFALWPTRSYGSSYLLRGHHRLNESFS